MADEPKAKPAPKRSFFKKPSWQTAAKTEGATQDIFSHSNDYANIVAEKARRLKEEEDRRKAEEAKKKAELESEKIATEDHDRKRRKVSLDPDASPNRMSRGPSSSRKAGDKKHINSSYSPGAKQEPTDTRTSRYTSITRSGRSLSPSKKTTQIIDLDDCSSDSDADFSSTKPIPSRERKRTPEEEDDDPHAPEIQALIAEVRARRLNNPILPPHGSGVDTNGRGSMASELIPNISNGTPTASTETPKQPIVQLFIESGLPDTVPLLIKIRISDTLRKPRLAWCARQDLFDAAADDIFLTWRGDRVWDATSIARLGVTVDKNGYISVKGDDNLYMDDEPPKIHLQAWTQELWDEVEREEAEEEARLRAEASRSQYEPVEPEEPKVVEKKISLVLKARGVEDVKIKVNPSTTFEHLASAYRIKRNIPDDRAISLYFDGERLKPMDTVEESEIEEMDSLEVHFN